MKKKNIFIGITLLAFIFILASLIYINNILLPQKIKVKLITGLEEYFKQNVDIKNLRYGLFKGLRIQGLRVYEKIGAAKNTTLEIKEISLNPIALPLFNKKIIIPALTFNSPQIYLKYRKDKTFNFPLLSAKKPAQKTKWDILIAKIRVRNGRIKFSDEFITPSYTKDISEIDISIDFNFKKEAKIFLQAKLEYSNRPPDKLQLSGLCSLEKKVLQANLKADTITLGEYAGCLKESGIAAWLNKPLAKNIIDQANFLKNLSAEFELSRNKLQIQKASFETMDAKFDLTGLLENFKSPKLSLNISAAEIKLQDLTGFWPNLKDKLKIQGLANIDLDLQVFPDKPFDIKGAAKIKDSQANTAYLKSPLTSVNCDIIFSKDELNWQNLTFDYKDEKFSSKGKIIDYKKPQIIFILASKLYNLNADLKTAGNSIKINSFKGFFKHTSFYIDGDIDISDRGNPLFNLNFDITTNPKEIAADLPDKFANLINEFRPDGICNLTGLLNTRSRSLRSWEINLKIASPEFSIYDFRLEDLFIEIEQANKLFKVTRASAAAYNGRIELNLLSNLAVADPPFNMEISASDIDLSKLKQDVGKWKEKDVSGMFSLTAESKGTLKDLNNLTSKGSASIKEGRLWELNLFKGLGEFLFLPSFKKVVFKEGSADFEIENQVIYSDNALFKSEGMKLLCQGNIGFDKKLQLLLTTEINPKLIGTSQDPRRFTTFLTGNFLLVRVDGTLDQPKYHISTIPQELLNDIKGYFLGKKK